MCEMQEEFSLQVQKKERKKVQEQSRQYLHRRDFQALSDKECDTKAA
jgi:hypothetical protein